jgi:hypothetical protein
MASSYVLSGAFIPWLVLISDPLRLCKGYCVLVTSQYAATVSSYWHYVQIPRSATPIDMIEVIVSVVPLAAAIPALYISVSIATSDRSPPAFLYWGYVFLLTGALIMALFAVLLALLPAPSPPHDWTELVLSVVQLTAIVILAADGRRLHKPAPRLTLPSA